MGEQQLVASLPAGKGRPAQTSANTLVETARPILEAMIQDVAGIHVVSLHHDISTVMGEEVVLFTLADSPAVRETRR